MCSCNVRAEKLYEEYNQFRAVIKHDGRVHWEPAGRRICFISVCLSVCLSVCHTITAITNVNRPTISYLLPKRFFVDR